jgi:hypothetical protein
VLRSLLSAQRDFDRDLQSLKSLRDEGAHLKDIMRSDAGLKIFVERIETAEAWLGMLSREPAGTGGGEVKVNRAATKHR